MIKKLLAVGMAAMMAVSLAGCKKEDGKSEPQAWGEQIEMPAKGEEIVVFETSKGTIKARVFPQYAPKAVENFVTHAKDGYYDGLIFHRVIEEFMIQGGDPDGNGTGGESIWGEGFGIEIVPQLRHVRGALAMAQSSAPDSIGSQFYIVQNTTLDDTIKASFDEVMTQQEEVMGKDPVSGKDMLVKDYFPPNLVEHYLTNGGTPSLDFGYTVFGQVFEGQDVVDAIAKVEKDGEKPVEDVIMEKVFVEKYK